MFVRIEEDDELHFEAVTRVTNPVEGKVVTIETPFRELKVKCKIPKFRSHRVQDAITYKEDAITGVVTENIMAHDILQLSEVASWDTVGTVSW